MPPLPALPDLATLQNAARRLPSFVLPPAVARIVARLPQQPPTLALTVALNLALGRILPREDLAPLNGRRLRLRVLDAGLTLDFGLGEKGFRTLPASAARPDLTLSATVRDFIALAAREEDADTLFFSRRLVMEGDTDLGLLVKNTLDAVDWEAVDARWSPAALLARLPLPALFATRPRTAA